MSSIIIIMFEWKLCSKCNFIVIFPILSNVADFINQTKEDANMRQIGVWFYVNSYIFRKYMAWAIVALPIRSQELGRGLFCPPPAKIGCIKTPNHYRVKQMAISSVANGGYLQGVPHHQGPPLLRGPAEVPNCQIASRFSHVLTLKYLHLS